MTSTNPTCTIEQYQGGLSCCTSGNILLSKDQNPWPENKLTYYMKWRFYFEDYTPAPDPKNKPEEATHQDLVRFFKCTEADAGEYDVVAILRHARGHVEEISAKKCRKGAR